jgi:aspartate aminotransferase-like enzyme
MNPYRLRLPGPTAVPERVREAIARPVVSHRGPEFRSMLLRAEELLQPILGTRNRVLFFAASGTGMMEASLVNVLGPGERVLIPAHGQFGERFAAIARSLGAHADTIDIPWGRGVDANEIETRVKTGDYRAVVVVHNESSTGVAADLEAIGAAVRGRGPLLIVDSVSGLAGMEMRQDEWGIDIVVSASQKALMCPPGVGIASMSPRAEEIVGRADRMGRYYWDFRKAAHAIEDGETAFTPPVSLVAGLTEALDMIHEEGLAQVLERHRRLAAALRAGCEALGLARFAAAEASPSSTVVCQRVPEGIQGGDIVRTMYQRHGSVIAGARNQLKGRVIRIGVMGSLEEPDIITDILHLESTLAELGCPAAPERGVAAAMKEFAHAW